MSFGEGVGLGPLQGMILNVEPFSDVKDNIPEILNFKLKLAWHMGTQNMKLQQKIQQLWVFSELVSSGVSLTSWREGASSALVGHPSSDGITIKIPYGLDVLLHWPALHSIFSYLVGEN